MHREKGVARDSLYILTAWFLLHKLTFNLLVGPWWPEFSLIPLVPLVLIASKGLTRRDGLAVFLAVGIGLSNFLLWALPRQNETQSARVVVEQIPLTQPSEVFILNPQFLNLYELDETSSYGGNGDTEVLVRGAELTVRLRRAEYEHRQLFFFLRPDLLARSPEDLRRSNRVNLWERSDSRLEKAKDILYQIAKEYELIEIGRFPYRYRGHISYGYADLAVYRMVRKAS